MKEIKVTLVKHKSAKDIVLSWVRPNHKRLSDAELMDAEVDFVLTIGDVVKDTATTTDLLAVVRKLSCWGYCQHVNKIDKEIHYWFGKKATDLDILNFLTHEVAHAAGYASENSACKIGGIAVFAYDMMKDNFPKMIKA